MGSFEEAFLYDMSTLPTHDGISMLMDFCPGADADCICDVVVTGIGTDVLDDVVGATSAGGLSGELHPNGIVLEIPCADDIDCGGGTCACVPTLVLAAADGALDDPPVRTEAVTVSQGPELCRTTDSGECDFVMWGLSAVTWTSGFPGAIGTEVTFEQGQTVRRDGPGGVSLRGIRASGYECAGELRRAAAWAAWGYFEGV